MIVWVFSIVVIATLLGSIFGVGWTLKRAESWGLVDQANNRSLHNGSKPRSGGLGLLCGITAGWFLAWVLGYSPEKFGSLVLAGCAVAAISLQDDLRDMPAFPRLVVHLLAGATPIFAGFGLGALEVPGWSLTLGSVSSAGLTILFVVWFINLYNFMDGMDGFAGGMTFFGFGALAVLGLLHGEGEFSLAASVVAASAAGFLVFNFPPARVFMGDVGAAPLGFLAAGFALLADRLGIAPLWVSVMIFSPFFLDATVTLICRVVRAKPVWVAHRSHYYQRLVRTGWSHRSTVLLAYLLMAGCGLSAVCVRDADSQLQWLMICGWLIIYAACAIFIHIREYSKGL